MRRISLAGLIVAGITVASFGFGRFFAYSQTKSQAKRHVLYYVDPMHPSYKSDKPGIAPDCGMQLVPVYEGGATNSASLKPATAPTASVAIDGNSQRLSGIRVMEVRKGTASRTAHVVGRVAPEDVRVYSVNSGVDGFIRETYNDSVGSFVKKDQKIASYYSPDFLAAASGFLAATERVPGTIGKDGAKFTPNWGGTIAKEGVRSIQGYTDHLRNLGMSDEQIKHIAEARELPDSIDAVSPVDGFILARNVTPWMHFDHMMEFYRIADLSKVWVVAEVSEADAESLHPGSAAQVTVRGSGRRLTAHVTNSLPQSEAGGDTAKVRLELDNPTFILRPDMVVDVDIPLGTMSAVMVPTDALVYSGEQARVYVERSEGKFEPHEVLTGKRMGGDVEIVRGVVPGDRIVVAGAFLVDSESRLRNVPTVPLATQAAMSAHMVPPSHTAAPASSSAPAPATAPGPKMGNDAAPDAAPDKHMPMPAHDHMASSKPTHDSMQLTQ
jgi:RND family efflux transporter MFP subunit